VWLAYLDLCKLLCIILLSWSLICLYTLIFSSRIDKRHFECTEIGSSKLKRMSWFVSFVLLQSYITSSLLSFVIGGLFSQGYSKFSFMQDIRPKKGGPLAGPRLVKRGGVPTSSYDGHLPTTLNHAFAM
jgi:hypothetical protein